MYQNDRANAIQAEIQRLSDIKRSLRNREKSLKARQQYLNGRMSGLGRKRGMGDWNEQYPANNVAQLRNSLNQSLPQYMVPGNVGGINEICWPFYFQANIDLGQDPTVAANEFTRGFFQVDQEAGFILQSIGISHTTDAAGLSGTVNAPLQVEFIDRQSSRRFNSLPTPIQMIGYNSNPSILPTPMYVQPNAFIDIVVNGIPTVAQTFQGSGLMQFSFFGLRMRTENQGAVLSTIFAR